MAKTEFHDRYQVLQQVSDGPVRSFHAMAVTGAVVMAHFVRGGAEVRNRVLAQIERLRPTERKRVLEITEVDDEPVIVTRFILDFSTLEAWLAAHQQAQLSESRNSPGLASIGSTDATPVSPDPIAPADRPPGEFTRMFARPTAEPTGSITPTPSSAPPGSGQVSSAPPRQEPGEFTRMFATPAHGGPAQPGGSPPAESQGQPAAAAPPGRPTAEPRAQGQPGATGGSMPDVSPTAGASQPGEFTSLFRVPAPNLPPPASQPAQASADSPIGWGGGTVTPPGPGAAVPAPPAAPNEPGDFTRIFGSVQPGAGPAAPVQGGQLPLFGKPGLPSPGSAAPPPLPEYRFAPAEAPEMPPATPAAPPPPPSALSAPPSIQLPPYLEGGPTPAPAPVLPSRPGPSEYTRIISGMAAPPPSPAQGFPGAAPPAQAFPGAVPSVSSVPSGFAVPTPKLPQPPAMPAPPAAPAPPAPPASAPVAAPTGKVSGLLIAGLVAVVLVAVLLIVLVVTSN